ncbi:hypothetical protein [Microbispora bryophytorum]|uniref:DUF1707 domain-containing protein n=1 Tax=Microbispora bryophytorum subsp. camponoti TaxID=1677852 RepID=A0ABR8KV47_9ACTN|nr:hypothetical protein [Microbispora camponoti]MBD3142610.1 hypothetical protein [Microbispora camponoti]
MRPADPDDIDARFEALVAQFDKDEIRRMTAAAGSVAPPPGRRRRPAVLVMIAGLVVLVGVVVVLRPGVLERLGIVRPAAGGEDLAISGPVVARPGPVLTPIPDGEEGLFDHGPVPAPAAGPFAGTPAVDYADGEQGLVMPAARALGGLTEKEVGQALQRVRRLLSAAHLDPATVRGGRPEAFARLLHPRQRETFLRHLDDSGPSGTRSWLFSLAPDAAEPVGDVVKVSGETTVSERAGGGVTIGTDYLFVHPVSRTGAPLIVTRVVERHRSEFSAYREGGKLVVWLVMDRSALFGANCGADNGFVHPRFPGDPQGARPSGEPVDPYDRASGVSGKPRCPAALGT